MLLKKLQTEARHWVIFPTTRQPFYIHHHKGALSRCTLANEILRIIPSSLPHFCALTKAFYLAWESSAVCQGKKTWNQGAIKSDISNGKVNSVFQMHFLEDESDKGFIHCKWRRLAVSLCLPNALMNSDLLSVITQVRLPQALMERVWQRMMPGHIYSQRTDHSNSLFCLFISSVLCLIAAGSSPVLCVVRSVTLVVW